ncbi:MAG TPA: anhydro-N-acetylmuramic acid kinase, partial [Gammaproteobacteria bacterium]|nr:anhydro-N-acetylmuramic acid kinase [Gammaproteobacteria bacterium]
MADYFIGLISGTSADGIDAALVEFSPAPRVIHARTFLYPTNLRSALLAFGQGQYQGDPVDQLGQLDVETGQAFAQAAMALLQEAKLAPEQITAIGSHGQTVRHRPDGKYPFSLQIGDPNTIAANTGLTVVADFRRRDMAEGGQGAPLAPAFHRAVFQSPQENRAVLNLG